jgi:hypothetical protein
MNFEHGLWLLIGGVAGYYIVAHYRRSGKLA